MTVEIVEPCLEPIEITDDIEGRVRVTLEYIGEGYEGDYDPTDPDDSPLVRFSIDERELGTEYWEAVDDSSYCTTIPITTPREQLESVARSILAEVQEPVLAGHSIKKLCERLSWIEV